MPKHRVNQLTPVVLIWCVYTFRSATIHHLSRPLGKRRRPTIHPPRRVLTQWNIIGPGSHRGVTRCLLIGPCWTLSSDTQLLVSLATTTATGWRRVERTCVPGISWVEEEEEEMRRGQGTTMSDNRSRLMTNRTSIIDDFKPFTNYRNHSNWTTMSTCP